MTETTTNKPVHVIRRKGIKVAIFFNRTGENEFAKVTAQKIYRAEDGSWKTATSFGRDDLPIVSLLTKRAWEWILDREAEPSQE
ncbi:hypothetical protein GC176_18375 [bacterium]|nr:hypothetical protein [bacterium]